MSIGGQELSSEARSLGLGISRQDPALLPDLTVAENMAVGVGYRRVGGLGRAAGWAARPRGQADLGPHHGLLRDGKVRGTFLAAEVDEAQIIERVIGRKLEAIFPEKGSIAGTVGARERLVVRDLRGNGFHDVSLAVREGEIIGLAGVQGNGQAALIQALAGQSPSAGAVEVDGRPVGRGSSAAAAAGVVYVPADRHREGLFLPCPSPRTSRQTRCPRCRRQDSSATVASSRVPATWSRVSRSRPRARAHRSHRCQAAISRRSPWRGPCSRNRASCCWPDALQLISQAVVLIAVVLLRELMPALLRRRAVRRLAAA